MGPEGSAALDLSARPLARPALRQRRCCRIPAGVERAGAYTNLGRLIGDNGQLEESLPSLTKSIDILEGALRQDRRLVKTRESLLIAYWARAMTLCGLQRFQQALRDWDGAIELDDGRYREALRLKRASNLLNLKDHARAAADAQAVAESAKASAQDLYNAAGVYALSARFAATDVPLAESYASRAVVQLRQALARGYKDLAHLKKDSALDALRARADFQKLLKELESVTKKQESGKPPG